VEPGSSARALLTSWTPPSPEQEQLRTVFVHYLDLYPDACRRSCRPDHFTASALVTNAARTRVLLGLHRKVGLWLQFGGHIEDADASVEAAALREAREESGVDGVTLVSASPLRLDRHPAPCGAGARHHLDVQFLAVAPEESRPSVSSESLDVAWFDAAHLPTETDDAVRALVSDATTRA
jgi:8-oxo-dGTP pyrophosphatase MutT (NUDIX family)